MWLMGGHMMKSIASAGLLAFCAACSNDPIDATCVGTNLAKTKFSDITNWQPQVVPTGIATIPATTQPPQPGKPYVWISSPVKLAEIRQGGGLTYGTDVTFTGCV